MDRSESWITMLMLVIMLCVALEGCHVMDDGLAIVVESNSMGWERESADNGGLWRWVGGDDSIEVRFDCGSIGAMLFFSTREKGREVTVNVVRPVITSGVEIGKVIGAEGNVQVVNNLPIVLAAGATAIRLKPRNVFEHAPPAQGDCFVFEVLDTHSGGVLCHGDFSVKDVYTKHRIRPWGH